MAQDSAACRHSAATMATSLLSEHKQNGKLFRTSVGMLLWTFYLRVSPVRGSNYRRERTWVRLYPRNVNVMQQSFIFRLCPTRSLPLGRQGTGQTNACMPDTELKLTYWFMWLMMSLVWYRRTLSRLTQHACVWVTALRYVVSYEGSMSPALVLTNEVFVQLGSK